MATNPPKLKAVIAANDRWEMLKKEYKIQVYFMTETYIAVFIQATNLENCLWKEVWRVP